MVKVMTKILAPKRSPEKPADGPFPLKSQPGIKYAASKPTTKISRMSAFMRMMGMIRLKTHKTKETKQ
jgi:hypothetical protein